MYVLCSRNITLYLLRDGRAIAAAWVTAQVQEPKYSLRSRDEIYNFIGFVIVVKKRLFLNHGILNLDEWFVW